MIFVALSLMLGGAFFPVAAGAQSEPISVATVTRPPFSFEEDGADVGFSLDLIAQVAERLDRPIQITRFDSFGEMLSAVEARDVDLAAANISVTSSREELMDFSRPIFASGLQIMVPAGGNDSVSLLPILLSGDMLLAVIGAFALLLAAGMIMWRFEREAQPYFKGEARETPQWGGCWERFW